MPVLELALLRSKAHPDPQTHQDALPQTLKTNLKHALTVLSKSTTTNHPFKILCENETQPQLQNVDSQGTTAQEYDPCNLYILGSWASIAEHEAFLPSEDNQKLLELIAGSVDVCWMFHVEGVASTTSLDKGKATDVVTIAKALVDGSALVALEQYVVPKERLEEFQGRWLDVRNLLEKHCERACFAGWRTGRVYGVEDHAQPAEDEFVVLSGWDSEKRYADFAVNKVGPKGNGLQQMGLKVETKFLRVAVTPE